MARPDLVRNVRDPAIGPALFALAAALTTRLGVGSDRVALTVYDGRGQPSDGLVTRC